VRRCVHQKDLRRQEQQGKENKSRCANLQIAVRRSQANSFVLILAERIPKLA
jgi:hypothetical protein